ncbi:hypothetical protein T05_9386 [Trichinella murrelli]|uniref:Uncharacterized protein n=1 Tax=Trichinella murrelli TaxID=144512 RepID=A0A0V0TGK9_9BILA|nr:hypothetical protein T05_9386 [Trichinella murrelli]
MKVNSGCRGAVYTNLEVNTVLRTPHAETSSVDNSILHKIEKMNTLKRCARKETKPVPQIYSEAYRSASTSLEAAGQFPTCKKVKAAMYRSHAKRFPPLLATRQQMEIPVQWLCTEENLRELAAHSVWCIDGTFKTVPEWENVTSNKRTRRSQSVALLATVPHFRLLSYPTPPFSADERGSIDGPEWVRPLEVLTKSSNYHTDAEVRSIMRAMDVQETDDYDALKSALFEAFGVRTGPERFSAEFSGENSNGAFPEMSGSADKNLLQQFKAELSTDTINAAVFRSGTDSFAEAIEFVAQEERVWRDFTTLKASVSSVKTDADKEATAAPVKTRKEVGKELAELHFKMNRQAGKRHLSFYELLRLLIDEQGSTETLIEQVTSGRVTTSHLRVKNSKYEDVQLRITALTAEYDGGTRTMKQFPNAVAYDVPEPVNF